MRRYIPELPDWPRFFWSEKAIAERLAGVARRQGMLLGRMLGLGFDLQQDAHLESATQDAVCTSAIEGEVLAVDAVRSSVARHLGIVGGASLPEDRAVEGIVKILTDAAQNHSAPLTAEHLLSWYTSLFAEASRLPTARLAGSTASPRRSRRSGANTTGSWKRRSLARSISPPGWSGISAAWIAPWIDRRRRWNPSCGPAPCGKRVGETPLNPRQRKILNLLLNGLDGHLTAEKWALLTRCARMTALRDINELLEVGLLTKVAGGRSTHYELRSVH